MTYAAAENIFGYWGESENEDFISPAWRETVRNMANLAVTKGLMAPAEVIYEEVGKQLLSESTRDMIRQSIEELCSNTSGAAVKFLGKEGAASAAKTLGMESAKATTRAAGKAAVQTAGKETAKTAVKTAGKEILKGVGRAAAVGGVVDAVFGTVEATRGYIRGEMDGETAVIHAVKETATGAVASGVGAAALAATIVFTGPVGWVLGAGIVVTSATGTKLGLNALFT